MLEGPAGVRRLRRGLKEAVGGAGSTAAGTAGGGRGGFCVRGAGAAGGPAADGALAEVVETGVVGALGFE